MRIVTKEQQIIRLELDYDEEIVVKSLKIISPHRNRRPLSFFQRIHLFSNGQRERSTALRKNTLYPS